MRLKGRWGAGEIQVEGVPQLLRTLCAPGLILSRIELPRYQGLGEAQLEGADHERLLVVELGACTRHPRGVHDLLVFTGGDQPRLARSEHQAVQALHSDPLDLNVAMSVGSDEQALPRETDQRLLFVVAMSDVQEGEFPVLLFGWSDVVGVESGIHRAHPEAGLLFLVLVEEPDDRGPDRDPVTVGQRLVLDHAFLGSKSLRRAQVGDLPGAPVVVEQGVQSTDRLGLETDLGR